MSRRQRRLDAAVASIQLKHGQRAIGKGSIRTNRRIPPHISTGFSAIDEISGCGGIPLNELSLLSGGITSGKLTIAYKILASAQQNKRPSKTQKNRRKRRVILIDLHQTCDPEYLMRCGVDLASLVVVQPASGNEMIALLLDLVASAEFPLIVVDDLAALFSQPDAARTLVKNLSKLRLLLKESGCALLVIGERQPLWLRWFQCDNDYPVRRAAALHIELKRERWLQTDGRLIGYRAMATVLRSRWAAHQRKAPVVIEFNGTVRARETW